MKTVNKILALVDSRVNACASGFQVSVKRSGKWENAGVYGNADSAVAEALETARDSYKPDYFAAIVNSVAAVRS